MAHEKHSHMTIHAHGDGTYHSEPMHMEHPSAAHAAAHFLKMHAEGDHVVAEGHDEGYSVHGVHDGEMHSSEHENLGAAKRQMGDCVNGECSE